jgi:hypothetical protein
MDHWQQGLLFIVIVLIFATAFQIEREIRAANQKLERLIEAIGHLRDKAKWG